MNKKGVLEYFTWGIYLFIIFIVFLTASIILNFVVEDEQKIVKTSDALFFNDIINEWNLAYGLGDNTNYNELNSFLSEKYITAYSNLQKYEHFDYFKNLKNHLFYNYYNDLSYLHIENSFDNYFNLIGLNYTLIINAPNFHKELIKFNKMNDRQRIVVFCYNKGIKCDGLFLQSYLMGVQNVIYSKIVKHYVLFENELIEYEVMYDFIE